MTDAEKSPTGEAISDQVVAYVWSHADEVTPETASYENAIREGEWKVDISMPLLQDPLTIDRIEFLVSDLSRADVRGDESSTGHRRLVYNVGLFFSNEQSAYYVYDPNSTTPYAYYDIECTQIKPLSEKAMAHFFDELKEMEAAGGMTKIEKDADE